jgi:DNA-binding transcriptional LysR family regulator
MVLVTQPGMRPQGIVTGKELSRIPLVLGDGLRAAMDALLAGRGIELNVGIEVNDHETIRLMVQQGAAASILPYSSVARECTRRLLAAHRITENGIFRTLALGVRASRTASLARETAVRTITQLVAEFEAAGQLSLGEQHQPIPRRSLPLHAIS